MQLSNEILLFWMGLFAMWESSKILSISAAAFSFSSSSSSNERSGAGDNFFSLTEYQKARAKETATSLDASRLHFQILFVDDDNVKGRIAEGLLARVAEYNDAMFVLFPASATIDNVATSAITGRPRRPLDAAPSDTAVHICSSLGLCPTRSATIGTNFDRSYLDEYDLIITMNDDIRSSILRSFPSVDDQLFYGPKCRLLSEFLSMDFCSVNDGQQKQDDKKSDNDLDSTLLNMLDSKLRDRVTPFWQLVVDRSSDVFTLVETFERAQGRQAHQLEQPRLVMNEDGAAVPNTADAWSLTESALIMASAGVTRFCLATMDAQFETAFQSLLQRNFLREEHLFMSWDDADDQMRKCSMSVTGYFSPEQRRSRLEQHLTQLRMMLRSNDETDD